MRNQDKIKNGVTVIKVLVWNRTGNERDDDASKCELTFSDETTLKYEIDDLDELENENIGIYEFLEDGTYIQIEDFTQ